VSRSYARYTLTTSAHLFVFREFNLIIEEIDACIFNYDRESKELVIFGHKFYLFPNLVSWETNIPDKGGVMSDHSKTPKVENT